MLKITAGHFNLAAAGLLFVLFAATPASSLTLMDLNNGASFSSGPITFEFATASVVISGAISTDLSNYEVVTIAGGFGIRGPITVADGNVGDIALAFTVQSQVLIVGASLFADVAASGSGATANVVETIDTGATGLLEMFVFATGDGGLTLVDDVVFAGATSLFITKDIAVVSTAPGQTATVSIVNQVFTIPEPASLALLAAGLAGLLIAGRRSPVRG